MVGAWIVLIALGLMMRRCVKRHPALEAVTWWYITAGLMEWSQVVLRILDNRGDVERMMESPVWSVTLGTLSYAICSLIWPLLGAFVITWFQNVPDVLGRIIQELAIAQVAAILLACLLTTSLRRHDRRSAARQERLDVG
jgi:hypothetical protein